MTKTQRFVLTSKEDGFRLPVQGFFDESNDLHLKISDVIELLQSSETPQIAAGALMDLELIMLPARGSA